jgi:carbonyl reductase 1
LAKVAARIVDATRPEAGISVNAACPGLVDTAAARPWFDDMSSAQSPSEAATVILWLALEPHAYRGALIQHRKEIP